MTNYKDSKIYKIVCRITGLVYIGSTTNKYLCNRLGQHVYQVKTKNNITSRLVLEHGDYYIELIELVICNSKDELLIRERYWIENTECVNKQIAGQTKQEYIEKTKEIRKIWDQRYRAKQNGLKEFI